MAGERERAQAVLDDLARVSGGVGLPVEGLNDLGSVNIKEQSQRVNTNFQNIERSDAAARSAAQTALTNLLATNYPEAPKQDVPEDVIRDMEAQRDSIQAALDRYYQRPPMATSVSATLGAPVPKPFRQRDTIP